MFFLYLFNPENVSHKKTFERENILPSYDFDIYGAVKMLRIFYIVICLCPVKHKKREKPKDKNI